MYQSIYINAFLLTVLIYRIEIYLLHMLSSMDLWRILEDLWNYCLLLPNIANCCQLLPTIDNHCLLLPTIANYCHHTIANLRTLVDRDCCLGNKYPPFSPENWLCQFSLHISRPYPPPLNSTITICYQINPNILL